jgi:hypothetical protein
MDKFSDFRSDIFQILEQCKVVMTFMEEYERNPVPSKEMGLSLQLSSLEIFMTNAAKSIRERLAV